ncbi:precorrin-6A synthase (deacetylating) [Gordonia sp. HY285]|uniref:precorrin-6A synthase (deacetylating) n=1 Tax=Gordonia liuliyuniae TaxID=2911517 RepID=UPI001EFF9232|nr:precorrin-6A synthase (deacetylating) [Gordonia liuliyuniae]MCF8609773.1 precorrin-6A synthase (deacetylating) [Gordonia liuliyuniae]
MKPVALRVIGIGPGGPRQITLDAVDAIAATDVFLILDKGDRTSELTGVRQQMLDAHAAPGHTVVAVPDPPRDRDPADYATEVRRWHAARVDAIDAALTAHLPDGGTAAFLVWGDPALYDSTLRLTDALARRRPLSVDVVPGVTSASALTAAHGIVAHAVGEPILTTTGRRLSSTPDGADQNQIVMLDSSLAFRETADPDDTVYWGACLGTEHEVLVSGRVADVADEIAATRARVRDELGWIMDIYLLQKGRG